MAHKFPETTRLLPNEEYAVMRIRLARYFGQLPSAIDGLSWVDVATALEIIRADAVTGNIQV